jgi:hypothetical protein
VRALCLTFSIAVLAASACSRDVVHEADEDHGASTRLVFDPATVQDLRGRIIAVQDHQRIAGSTHGVRVLLETTDEQVYVYLAPQGYFDEVKLELRPGETLGVRGSVLDGDGRRAVIAQSISVGTAEFSLRDAEGRPKWREWRSSRDWK